jgi:hypothetical protein
MKERHEEKVGNQRRAAMSASHREGAAWTALIWLLQLQELAGNTAVNEIVSSRDRVTPTCSGAGFDLHARELKLQRFPHLNPHRQGTRITYILGRSWRVGWSSIHPHVASIPHLAHRHHSGRRSGTGCSGDRERPVIHTICLRFPDAPLTRARGGPESGEPDDALGLPKRCTATTSIPLSKSVVKATLHDEFGRVASIPVTHHGG